MRRMGLAALGALLLALPVHAQSKQCAASGSTTSTSTSTASAASTATSSRALSNTSTSSTAVQAAQLQNQIVQLRRLQAQLLSGEVTPPANSGVTTAQAVQVVSRRIALLQNAAAQLSSSSNLALRRK